MLAIEFKLLTGRFHGTSWDHNVNEGVPEWPPSPWRILRALVAAAHRLPIPPARDRLASLLLDRMGGPPTYGLPRAGAAHTRHYMPQGKIGASRKVFDSFIVAEGRDPAVVVSWPDAALAPDEAAVLDGILEHLTYLGRAETWVEARRLESLPDASVTARPTGGAATSARDTTRLLAPATASEFETWRRDLLTTEPALGRMLPVDRLDALLVETSSLEKHRWSAPPGSRWFDYEFESHERAARTHTLQCTTQPNWALFHVSAPRGSVLPLLEDAVLVGDRVRRALMSLSGDGTPGSSHPVFSGKTPDGSPMHGHLHALVLPFAEHGVAPRRGLKIDRVLLWSPSGFPPSALAAMESLRVLANSPHLGAGPLRFELVAAGARRDAPSCPILSRTGALEWRSLTPFVPQRHPRRGRDAVAEQVARALVQMGHPQPVDVAELCVEPGLSPWHRFALERPSGGGARSQHRGYGFRVRFAEPVHGPVVAGYGAHYGLGLFTPLDGMSSH